MEDSPWFRLWNKTYNKLIDLIVTPQGGVGGHIWIESGKKSVTKEELESLGWEIVSRFLPMGETTYCNMAFAHAAARYGCFDFRGLLANEIITKLSTAPGWQLSTFAKAIGHAQAGGLACLGKSYPKHGHIAIVAPRPGQLSGSWGVLSPVVFNVGKRNGLMKASEAFPVKEGMPQAWIYA